MKRLLSPFEYFLFSTGFYFQLSTRTAAFSNDNDNISINKNAIEGSHGLNNYSDPNDVYVHFGLITSARTDQDDWKHALFTWGTATAAAKATSLGNNRYSYIISNIRTFFSVCGQQMGNVFSGILTKGIHPLPLAGKINYLAAGMYLLKVQSNNS